MNSLIRKVDGLLSLLGKILVGLLASGVIVSVFLRYVFSIAFVWSEELLTMVFVATTFFGAALGLREQEHIAITYFIEKMPAGIRKLLAIITNGVIIVVAIFTIVYSMRMIGKVGGVPSPATGIQRGVYYAIIPITFAITVFYAAMNILGQFIHVDEPVKGYKDDLDLLQSVKREV
ncbi:MAG: TRAP transporter small permease [Sphaerochaeta sp.]|nr:TRAP transporter small permease [Sphaerochaeta sp.]PKL29440.1 MAG: hypothetical protein CVV46_01680 [Spirochaetae bacterium HGW-Spirochaetae-2]